MPKSYYLHRQINPLVLQIPCLRRHLTDILCIPPTLCVPGRKDTYGKVCVCCDCSSRGAGLREGERAGERAREVGGGVCLFLLCFLMVTAPPEPTGGKKKKQRERKRETGTEMMEHEERWLAV